MGFRNMAVYIEVARGLGDGDENAVMFTLNGHLAPQPRGSRQTKGLVKHVLLIFTRLWKSIVHIVLEYDVTSRASTHTFACPLQLDFMPLRLPQKIAPHSHWRRFNAAILP